MKFLIPIITFLLITSACKKDVLEVKNITPNPIDTITPIIPNHKCESHIVKINVDSLIHNYIPAQQSIKTIYVCECDTIIVTPVNYFTDSVDVQFDVFHESTWIHFLDDTINIYESGILSMDVYYYDTTFVYNFYTQGFYDFIFEDCE